MNLIEEVTWQGEKLAIIIRSEVSPTSTTFFTPDNFNLQVGYVVQHSGKEIARHTHLPVERNTRGTSEVLIVRQGRCEVDIYSSDQTLVATHLLNTGDILVMASGGHGFRMLEDTILLEIKQGPYPGVAEKERF